MPVESTVTVQFNAHKKDGNLTFLTCQAAFQRRNRSDNSTKASNDDNCYDGKNDDNSDADAVFAALDLARVCDVVMLVMDGNGPNPDDNDEQTPTSGRNTIDRTCY